jgi:undecaprenyl phosphate-alpha-L-ara4N flippase subunit ArnE
MSRVALGLTLVVICAILEAGAQICFKLSGLRPGRRMVWIAAGAGAYGCEIVLYTLALREIDLTVAFVMGSLSFVAVAGLSRILLREKITFPRGAGLLLILSGVVLMGAQA